MANKKRPWKELAGMAIYVASNFTAQRSKGCVAPFPSCLFSKGQSWGRGECQIKQEHLGYIYLEVRIVRFIQSHCHYPFHPYVFTRKLIWALDFYRFELSTSNAPFLNSSVPFANCLPRLSRPPAAGLHPPRPCHPPVLKLFLPSPCRRISHEIAALTSP